MSEPAINLLILERIDAAQNMSRYYVLSITPTLFGDTALVRECGRIGISTRRFIDLHEDRHSAGEALQTWLRRKTKRGYVIAYGAETYPTSRRDQGY